ncbi:MAG: carbamoyltransferase HypF, partial [Ramlibacter sp.]|nr:carbamoyltransferase HypF [Ramlibacter sp.]
MSAPEGRRIRVRGMVQGVGFRPTVWRLAQRHGITGEVRNDGDGVLIEAWGAADAIEALVRAVRSEAPPLARIESLDVSALDLAAPDAGTAPAEFRIGSSRQGEVHTAIVPDAATCTDCLADIRDPGDRRHGYAFTNCTHCGPRLSIVQGVPYDRARTTMAGFVMCTACRREYENPADRRFHAQPTACPACGPRLRLEDAAGTEVKGPDGAIAAARAALLAGGIVAIKGLGGFHLVC